MGKHDKFRAYWESIGKPEIEYSDNGKRWTEASAPAWDRQLHYRIKGDPHWELRRKWVDSDFTLPIEMYSSEFKNWTGFEYPKVIQWHPGIDYREAVQQDENKNKSPLSAQVGGNHYAKLGNYQPWQVLEKWMTPEELKGAMKKDVIGYLCREADKGGREDIEKAMHTIQIYLELTK